MEVLQECLKKGFKVSYMRTLPGECRLTIDDEIPEKNEFLTKVTELVQGMNREVTHVEIINQIVITFKV